MDDPGLSNFLHELVVQLRTLVNQTQFGQVTELHAIVESPLHQEHHHEPIEGDDSQGDVQSKQPDDGYSDREGDFAPQVQH